MTTRLLAIAGTLLVAALSLSLGREPAGPILRATAGGAMQLESTRDGAAVLSASRLRPGDSADGTLTLTSRAPGPQHLTLGVSALVDTPGAGGGALSRWVDLRIERGADVVYTGKLGDMPGELDLGDLAPGSSTPFRFTVTLPEQGPAVDDAYAGGSVEVSWSWRGDADGEGPEPPDPPKPPEPPKPTGEDVAPPSAPADVAPSGRDEVAPPSIDELEGPPSGRPSAVRLWLGGRATQRLGSGLALSAACRPGCELHAAARVRVGGRWRALGRRSLGTVAPTGEPSARAFRLSTLQRRSLRATLRRHGALTVRIEVTATAAGHRAVTKLRTLRLHP